MGEAKTRKRTGKPSAKKKNPYLPWVIGGVVVAAIVGLVVYLSMPPAPDSGSLPVASEDAGPFPAQLDRYGISVGEESAPVVVREFADYQCPACGRFAEASSRLKDEYVDAGEVRFVYFDLPLPQHDNAVPAAEAARCAGDQGSYWEMHDALYDNQSEWSSSGSPRANFTRYATDLELDERRFRRCLDTELHREAVERSAEVARQLRVASTPTVIVDNIPLTRPGWGQLSAVVERELDNSRAEN